MDAVLTDKIQRFAKLIHLFHRDKSEEWSPATTRTVKFIILLTALDMGILTAKQLEDSTISQLLKEEIAKLK